MKRLPGRIVSLLLALGITLSGVFASAQGDTGISEAEAIRIAWACLQASGALSDEALADYHVTDVRLHTQFVSSRRPEEPAWQVSLAHTLLPELAYTVNLSAENGETFSADPEDFAERLALHKEYQPNKLYIIKETLRWEAERGKHHLLWPYQDKAAFYDAYGYSPGYSSLRRGLPGDEDLTEAAAIAIARDEIRRQLAIDPAELDALLVDTSFVPAPVPQVAPDESLWYICLRYPDPDDPAAYPMRFQVTVPSPAGKVTAYLSNPGIEPYALAPLPDALYYNPEGGEFFHSAWRCETVSWRFLPLHRFNRTLLHDAPYNTLSPCRACMTGPLPTDESSS